MAERRTNRSGGISLLLGAACLFLAAPVMAQGVVVIKSHDLEPFNQALAGFVAACNEQITEYNLRGNDKTGASILTRLSAAKPKLILALGALAAQVVKDRIQDVPVVFSMVSSPQQYGLSGDNIAGISLDIPVETQLARFKALVPTIRTIGALYDPEKTGAMVEAAQVVADTFGLQLLAAPVASPKEVPTALRSLLGKIDALWMLPDNTVVTPKSFDFLLMTAFEQHLPFLAVSDIFVEVGALAALSPDYVDVGRQACQLARDLARDRRSLSAGQVLPPAKVNLAVNLKTASRLGLTLPADILQTASKVYR